MYDLVKSFLRDHLPAPIRRRVTRMRRRNKVDEVDIVHDELWPEARSKVMIDVGAHHGESLEEFALQDWRILAFEPDSVNRSVLERRVAEFPAVKIDARAVSDRAQDAVSFFRSRLRICAAKFSFLKSPASSRMHGPHFFS